MNEKKAQRMQKKQPFWSRTRAQQPETPEQGQGQESPQENSQEYPSWYNAIYRGLYDEKMDWNKVVEDWRSGIKERRYPRPKRNWLSRLLW